MKKADAIAVFLLYLLVYFSFGYLAAVLETDALALQCAFTLAVGAIPFLYAALRRIPFRAFFCAGNFSAGLLAGALLCMAGASILSGEAQIVSSLFTGSFSSESSMQLDALLVSYPRPLVFVASAILPALCEETLFRGFILSALRKSPEAYSGFRREAFAVFACALLFAAAHMDPLRFLSSFISGLAISYAACAAGSLVLPMAMHFFNNSAALLLYFAVSDAFRDNAAGYSAAAGDAAVFAELEMAARLSAFSPALPFFLFAAAVSGFLIFAGAKIIRRLAPSA